MFSYMSRHNIVIDHLVSKKTLLDIIFNSTDFPYLYVMDENSTTNPWKLEFFVNPPEDQPWVNVKSSTYYTKDKILAKQTFISVMDEEAKQNPSDSSLRWAQINPLWDRGSDQLIKNKVIKREYINALLKSVLAEGVQYVETRRDLVSMYELSTDPKYKSTNGKKYLGDKNGDEEIEFVTKLVDEFIKENPSFIGIKFIIHLRRFSTKETVEKELKEVIRVHQKYPNVVVGGDFVAEEDNGNSHLFFAENLLSIYDSETKMNKVNLYLHTGETSFPDDQRMSPDPMDPTSALQNTYDAIVLGSNRVGHGLGFIKHPFLMKLLKKNNIAVEICPVSNQLLGLVPDLRNHPAQNYLRNGVPIVLGSDDPGTFGYDYFTVDWYMICLGWGLDLADLKLVIGNSINYSAMNKKEKEIGLQKLNKTWTEYIEIMKKEACSKTFSSEPLFARMFPTEGALTEETEIKLFGTHFEAGICHQVKCKFGEDIVDAKLESVNLISCASPPREGATEEHTVPVSVTFNGEDFMNTFYNFTYKYEIYTHPFRSESSDMCQNSGYSVFRLSHTIKLGVCVFIFIVTVLF